MFNNDLQAVRIFREVNPPGDGGHIFNVSSAGGYFAQPSIPYYAAAKFGNAFSDLIYLQLLTRFFFSCLVALEGFTESLRKEMTPNWNIQATIIEPGGFDTEWKNMTIIPPLPAYDTDNSPTKMRRTMLVGGSIPSIGSPIKAAKAFISLAENRQDLPLRVQFGSDSLAIVQHTATKTISDGEKWESISHSTNVDGIDSKEYTKNLLAALG